MLHGLMYIDLFFEEESMLEDKIPFFELSIYHIYYQNTDLNRHKQIGSKKNQDHYEGVL